jgi:mycothiol synthase
VVGLAFGGASAPGAAENRETFLAGRAASDVALGAAGESSDVPPTEGLWEARREGRLVGAVAVQLQAGRVGIVWPPRLVPREPLATAQQLLAVACAGLVRRGACLAHAILERVTRADAILLRDAGFRPMATLLYLLCPESEMPTDLPAGKGGQAPFAGTARRVLRTNGACPLLEFVPFDPSQRDRLAQLIEATYADTLDCPMLNGRRNMDDTLTGYQSAGVFDPRRWFFVRHRECDVGCLLLADHPQHDNWELVYMGLVPSARGSRWGQAVVRHAQWLTRQAGRERLVLAVDAANHPAVTMYTDVGFRTFGRRRVYLKSI